MKLSCSLEKVATLTGYARLLDCIREGEAQFEPVRDVPHLISHINEYGLTQRLQNPIMVF